MTARQLPLMIPGRPTYDEASFLADASNEAARTWLDGSEIWPDRRLALWGESGRGKTHLLRIWAARTGAEVLKGRTLAGFPGIASPSGAAVDDADRADDPGRRHRQAQVEVRLRHSGQQAYARSGLLD